MAPDQARTLTSGSAGPALDDDDDDAFGVGQRLGGAGGAEPGEEPVLQAVQQRLADVFMEISAARLLVTRSA